MAINGIGTYGVSYYKTMYSANTAKNLLSGMSKMTNSASDPLASMYKNLSNSALYKTKGYRSLVNAYCAKKANELQAQQEENVAELSEKKDEPLKNLTYNASGTVSATENGAVSGLLLNMQI